MLEKIVAAAASLTLLASPAFAEPPKKGPCPSYICKNQSPPTPPEEKPWQPPESKSESPDSKKSNDHLYGGIALAGGLLAIGLGAMKETVCTNSGCQSEIPAFGYVVMAGGTLSVIDGLYLLFR